MKVLFKTDYNFGKFTHDKPESKFGHLNIHMTRIQFVKRKMSKFTHDKPATTIWSPQYIHMTRIQFVKRKMRKRRRKRRGRGGRS